MLDPDSINSSLAGEKALNESVTEEALKARKAHKRNMIVSNALGSIEQLFKQPELPAESLQTLRQALGGFIEAAPQMRSPAPVPKELVDKAKRVLAQARS